MKWLLALFSIVISYLWVDPLLATFLHTHPLPSVIPKILSLLIAPTLHLCVWTILTCFTLLKRWRKHLPTIAPYFLMIGTVMLIAGILKIAIGRARPDLFLSTGLYGCSFLAGLSQDAFRSFPSSHSATAFGLVYLWTHKKPLPTQLFYYLLAALLTSSRLFTGHHYLSDLIGGGCLGILAAQFSLYGLKKQIGQAICLPDNRSQNV